MIGVIRLMLNKLRHLMKADHDRNNNEYPTEENTSGKEYISQATIVSSRQVSDPQSKPNNSESDDTIQQAEEYLSRVQEKMNRLAEEFAAGKINRDQFQELFTHYQRERRMIESWVEVAPESEAWQKATTEGMSVVIRKQHRARILGYSIYSNESGMPIVTVGRFEVDAALVVPMLSSYRSATEEIFGAGMSSSEIGNGRWLCFVPGKISTIMAIFSTEPAPKQMDSLNELHRLFESANRHLLRQPVVDPDSLVLPHQAVLAQTGRLNANG